MTSDILTGHALDEAVAKMMGWHIADLGEGRIVYTDPKMPARLAFTFRSPHNFFDIVLPWAREQGWEIHINCIARVWGVELYDAAKHDYPFIGEALADDMITAVLNALVCASEGQS